MIVAVLGPHFRGQSPTSKKMLELEDRLVSKIQDLEPTLIFVVARAPYFQAALQCKTRGVELALFVPVTMTPKDGERMDVQYESEAVPQMIQEPTITNLMLCREKHFHSVTNVYRPMALMADAFVGFWDGKDSELARLVLWATQFEKPFYNVYMG
jgi:hypothetical protein